ncbi:anti-sigma factor RsbA family regulatory protein [Amycolatopsis keratiniphila]|uniref:anti-sigma factor RsbA family regulatory protein n=1 Tax=Amycolatopsis keratiniphila TaxID=129921 RepID=UPI00087B1D21|nr:anti-sigma factor RsbA family regulatory protein [Amycolatopsis keratiniphila]OLZ58715.1 anti-sigma regulatory factor [Amycolatopsis keratiniphila subsp. nogabecina]SDU69337.1 Anti-sigma regulatory factor (Ser/Thr protein kinase) [Amycolatopsis keratiniphila]
MVSPAADTDPFVHPALFYRGQGEYLAGTVPFIRQGLGSGEPVAVSVPGPNLELLRTALGQDAGRVLLLDMTQEGRNPGRIIPGVLRAFADDHPGQRVRIIGEPVWAGRSELEYPACAQHEALINLAFTGREVTILCPYDVARLDTRALTDAEATHPLLIDATGERASDGYDPLRIIDGYNTPLPEPAPIEPAAHVTLDAVSGDTASLARTRAIARDQARRAGLTGDRVEDVELVVVELVANSVDHGGGQGRLDIWIEPGRLVCEIRDTGHLTDPLAGRRPAPPGQMRGRGLLLINHLSDLVRLHTGPHGTTVRVCFTTPQS